MSIICISVAKRDVAVFLGDYVINSRKERTSVSGMRGRTGKMTGKRGVKKATSK